MALTATTIGVLALISLPLQSTRDAGNHTFSTVPTSNASTTLSEGPLVFVSPTSEQGLQLRVVLNWSVIPTNGTLGAQIAVYNTLDKNVSVSVTEDKEISTWNGRDFLCGWNRAGNLLGFAVFKGDVAATNLSEAGQQLHLDPQLLPYVVIGCPTEESFPANATFFPASDRVAYAYGVVASVNPKTLGCAYTEQESQCTGIGLVGYWNDSVSTGGNLGFSSPAFSYFPPGEYTIVATDEWNQHVYTSTPPSSCSRRAPLLRAPSPASQGQQRGRYRNGDDYPPPFSLFDVLATGNVNATLIGAGQACLLP